MAVYPQNESFDFDVIIVGGGPAGVTCAIAVAKKGFKVAIIDKKSRESIGDKTCGDAVDKAAMTRVSEGIGIDHPSGKELSDNIKKMSIAVNNIHTKVSLDAPGYLVDRLNFGQRLLSIAEEYGVEIIDSAPVRDIILETINGEKYLSGVIYNKNGIKQELRGKFTIDASGAYACIRKLLPDEFLTDGIKKELSEDEIWPTYREIIQLNENVPDHDFGEEILLLYNNKYPPPAYFWIFSKGNHQLNVGIGWLKSQNFGSLKKWYQEELNNYYKSNQYTVLKSGGGQIPFRPPFDNLVFNGGALAGDAACMVHPVTAEGHGPALDTGWRLGTVLANSLAINSRSKKDIWEYNIIVSNHYRKKHVEAEILRKMLVEVGTSNIAYLFEKKIFTEEELNLIFTGGNLELTMLRKVNRVLKLLLRPNLLIKLRKTLNLVDKCSEIFKEYPEDPILINQWREKRNKLLGMNY